MIRKSDHRNRPSVRIVDDTLVVGLADRIDLQVRREEVRRVDMYKSDQITVDLICCDIVFGVGDDLRTATLHEELEGWDDLLGWLGALPGFNADWWSVVVKPAFAENRTTVFETSPA